MNSSTSKRRRAHEPVSTTTSAYETRRQFLSRGSNAVSWAALAALLGRDGFVGRGRLTLTPSPRNRQPASHKLPARLHFAPKAKQVIYLHMVGGPPQMDMYDYKPAMDAVVSTRTCPTRCGWASG